MKTLNDILLHDSGKEELRESAIKDIKEYLKLIDKGRNNKNFVINLGHKIADCFAYYLVIGYIRLKFNITDDDIKLKNIEEDLK